MTPGIKRQLICFLKETSFTDACNGLLQLHVDQITRVRNHETTKSLTGELGFYNDDDSTVYPFKGIWLPDKKQYQVTFKEGSFSLGKDEMEKGKLTVTWKHNEYSFLSGPRKLLLSVAQRKQVIGELFKKDKKTGQILLFFTDELLYEKPGEKLRKKLEYFVIAQIESIDKNYRDIYLREIIFGPPRESFAPGATLATTNPITKRSESTRLMHITYNKDLNMFNVTTGVADNTYNSFGQFNHSKKFVIDVWENEDARSLTNAFVGRERHINITSSKLPKDILKIVTENSFDEIYKQVWDNNHKKLKPLVYYYITGREAQISDIHISNILYYNEDRLASSQGEILDNQYIYYKGIKSKGINKNPDSLYEKITIKISPNDVIIAEANYPHSPTTHWTITNSEQETFIVTGTSGIFKGANKIVIEYDNDLTKDFSQSLDQEIKNQGLKFRRMTVTF